jgi:hypothetical protein
MTSGPLVVILDVICAGTYRLRWPPPGAGNLDDKQGHGDGEDRVSEEPEPLGGAPRHGRRWHDSPCPSIGVDSSFTFASPPLPPSVNALVTRHPSGPAGRYHGLGDHGCRTTRDGGTPSRLHLRQSHRGAMPIPRRTHQTGALAELVWPPVRRKSTTVQFLFSEAVAACPRGVPRRPGPGARRLPPVHLARASRPDHGRPAPRKRMSLSAPPWLRVPARSR